MTSDLERHLLEFDGVAVTILSEARAACRDAPGYSDDLIRLCCDPRAGIAAGATWILKAEADDGARFDATTITPLMTALGSLPSWQASLHVCQAAEALQLSPEQAGAFFDWAASLTDHARPFLRAWSLHAMVITALSFDSYRDAAEAALAAADDDPAASVRARARKLGKRLERDRRSQT